MRPVDVCHPHTKSEHPCSVVPATYTPRSPSRAVPGEQAGSRQLARRGGPVVRWCGALSSLSPGRSSRATGAPVAPARRPSGAFARGADESRPKAAFAARSVKSEPRPRPGAPSACRDPPRGSPPRYRLSRRTPAFDAPSPSRSEPRSLGPRSRGRAFADARFSGPGTTCQRVQSTYDA